MSKMNTKIAANTKDKAGIPSKINRIACFVGFLFSVVLLVVLANSSYKCLMLHATGYTTEAIVVEKLRKSKVRIQFTDMAGKPQTASISLPIQRDRDSLSIKYSPEYPGAVVSCEISDIIIIIGIMVIAILFSLCSFLALFPYSWFRKRTKQRPSDLPQT